MYFHYPSWLGSMPDPFLVPPPPVIFKPYFFKPEKATWPDDDNDKCKDSYADDDIGTDYGPEYVRPTSHPPPPEPPKKEDYFDYRAYTRFYKARPYPFPQAHEYPSYSRGRQYGYAPPAYEYYYTNSHSHQHTYSHPNPHPYQYQRQHPHPQSHAPQHPRNAWSTQEGMNAWRAKQKKIWEEWERRTREARAQPSSTPRRSESSDGWREGWFPPRSPSPSRSDGGWQDPPRFYTNAHSDEPGHGSDQKEQQWSWDHSPRQDAPLHSRYTPPSEARLSEAFQSYCKHWETLLAPGDTKRLLFRNIPWPQYPLPRTVEDIDMQNVRAFLMAAGRPLKVSLREALLRFHPDKTVMLLAHVAETDKADVAAGCEAVTRCLSQLMKSATL